MKPSPHRPTQRSPSNDNNPGSDQEPVKDRDALGRRLTTKSIRSRPGVSADGQGGHRRTAARHGRPPTGFGGARCPRWTGRLWSPARIAGGDDSDSGGYAERRLDRTALQIWAPATAGSNHGDALDREPTPGRRCQPSCSPDRNPNPHPPLASGPPGNTRNPLFRPPLPGRHGSPAASPGSGDEQRLRHRPDRDGCPRRPGVVGCGGPGRAGTVHPGARPGCLAPASRPTSRAMARAYAPGNPDPEAARQVAEAGAQARHRDSATQQYRCSPSRPCTARHRLAPRPDPTSRPTLGAHRTPVASPTKELP